MKNDRGVTYAEVGIYLALFTVVALLLGKQFRAMIEDFSSGRRIVAQQTDSRDILGLMVREIRNTGLKNHLSGGGGSYSTDTDLKVIVGGVNHDSSSFVHSQGVPYDALTIMKIGLDGDGLYDLTDTIRFFVEGTTLRRELKSSKWPYETNSVVAKNVYALQYEFGVLGADSLLLSDQSPNTANWSISGTGTPSPSLSGSLDARISSTGRSSGSISSSTAFKVTSDQKLTAIFKIVPLSGLDNNIDSLYFSIKKADGTRLGFEKFKPYNQDMSLTIWARASTQAYAVIDYWAKGPETMTIHNVMVRRADLGTYRWTSNPSSVAQKKNVRAIRIHLLTRTGTKTDTRTTDPIRVNDEVTVTPEGEYTWRLYSETIETPNNGVF